MTAKHNVDLIVAVSKAESLPLHIETVREAYAAEGKDFDLDKIHYYSEFFKSYLQNLVGDARANNVGAFTIIGPTVMEFSMIPEVARSIGAMSIGSSALGTFFIYSPLYDYSLIGEEMFAASAYITEEPAQIATIAAEDVYKFAAIALSVLGTILLMVGIDVAQIIGM
jgi:hypothetical protein